jgi:hypothetical protein
MLMSMSMAYVQSRDRSTEGNGKKKGSIEEEQEKKKKKRDDEKSMGEHK